MKNGARWLLVSIAAIAILAAFCVNSRREEAAQELSATPVPDNIEPGGEPVPPTPAQNTAQPAASASILNKMARLLPPSVLQDVGDSNQQTAARIANFAQTGNVAELRAIQPEQARQLAQFVAQRLGRSEIALFANQYGAIPENLIPANEADLENFLLGWFYALRGDSAAQAPAPPSAPAASSSVRIGFCTNVVGRVGSAFNFPAGIGCVYGMFENTATAAGLQQVFAIWRDLSADRVTFQECETIRPDTSHNYVWLNLPAGWSASRCQLELFNPADKFQPVASGKFNIRHRPN